MKRLMIAAFSALLLVSNLASQTKGKVAPYTGDGGKGLSLAILAPKGNGLATSQNYLPDLVQGEFVSNFSGYSAISVLDRVSLDKVIAETLDPTYKDNLDIVRLGHVTQTGYIMTGTVTKTASGYALQAQITSTADGMTKASYSGTCTAAELDNLIGVRRASLELLGKMNVQLTERAKQELSGAGQTNYVNAQTALARGIVAQRSGNTVETMARFYEAAAYDPSFAEATTRANAMSAGIRTGNLGENIRNDIAWRDEWVKIRDNAAKFILAHPPVIAQIIYNPNMEQGKTNYNRRTADFTFTIDVKGVPYPSAYIRMIKDLNDGLAATRRSTIWELEPLSLGEILRQGFGYYARIDYTAELVNSDGKVIAQTSEGIQGGYGLGNVHFKDTGTAPDMDIDRDRRRDGGWLYPVTASFTAKADDITDQMSIRLSAKVWPRRDIRVYDNSSTDYSKYPVEVITLQESLERTKVNGLPPMATRELNFSRKNINDYGTKFLLSIIVETPGTMDERVLLLSYRPNFPDGRGVLIEASGKDDYGNSKGIPSIIDTTNYRFPISVAYLVDAREASYAIAKIIDIAPGSKERVPKEISTALIFGKVTGILIVPKGWFSRAKIRKGDLVRATVS